MGILAIEKRLEEGHVLTYDTVCRNLKQMYENGMLNREAKGGNINQNTRKRHWNYYYNKKTK